MKRAYSVHNVMTAKFATLPTSGVWRAAMGEPEPRGTWIIYGPPKNGKTSFAMMLAKYLTAWRRVAYNSREEGLSMSIRRAMERVDMAAVGSGLVLVDMDIANLIEYLEKHKSPGVVIMDSIQFLDMKFSEYLKLKSSFSSKLFVYISHVEGNIPAGGVARRIWRDASVVFRIEGFKAFPTGRYGGGEAVTISEAHAGEYWGN
jgi:hypothetical protein